MRRRSRSVPTWIVVLLPSQTEKEVLLPVGGLEQYFLSQLKPAQEKVSEIEQKLRQVREFYAKNKSKD